MCKNWDASIGVKSFKQGWNATLSEDYERLRIVYIQMWNRLRRKYKNGVHRGSNILAGKFFDHDLKLHQWRKAKDNFGKGGSQWRCGTVTWSMGGMAVVQVGSISEFQTDERYRPQSTLIHLHTFLSCHHPTSPLWSTFTPFLSCHQSHPI